MLDRIANKLSLSILMAVALAVATATLAWSQQRPAHSAAQSAEQSQSKPSGSEDHANRPASTAPRLPADATTDQSVELPGRTLKFKATAGSIPLNDGEGTLQAEIAYVAYVIEGSPASSRPVTFVFNGGPGAASSYLQLGALGPWRLPLEHVGPSMSPVVIGNADTWLDFTDLVFIDPVGTGYSRFDATGDAVRRQFWSVDGDAQALGVFIRKWIEKTGRQASAKFIVGESYGGFRAPKVARVLQGDQGVGVSGLILISPVLDFGLFGQRRHSPMSWVVHLPSMAATVLDGKALDGKALDGKVPEGKGTFNRDALRDVERYAAGDYLADLMRGERDSAAVERISPKVAEFTGLDPALVRRLAGRVDTGTFQRELNRQRGLVASAYDATVTGFDPNPTSANSRFEDPMLSAMGPPLTSAMTDLYQRVLHWRVDAPFHLLNHDISSRWDYGRGRAGPEVVDDLRQALAFDPRLRVLVTHGASDLVTPYFADQLILDQMPVFGSADRLKLAVYGGGHMYYSRDASRHALRGDAEQLYRAAVVN
jgi:carboxypeptidase C (cathepsin A)